MLLALTFVLHSMLPAPEQAKAMLDSFMRHHEWIEVPVDGTPVSTFVAWPERATRAPVVIISDDTGAAGDWIRAVADQVAAEGFIALVPDAPGAARRDVLDAVQRYAAALPAADGTGAR